VTLNVNDTQNQLRKKYIKTSSTRKSVPWQLRGDVMRIVVTSRQSAILMA